MGVLLYYGEQTSLLALSSGQLDDIVKDSAFKGG